MNFFLNVTVAGLETTRLICADHHYWFRKGDDSPLTLFFTDRAAISEVQRLVKNLEEPESAPIRVIADPIPFEQLHRYYGKKGLLNEWIPYRRGDLFRIYRLLEPTKSDKSYETQPVSIQFDVRYDQTTPPKYRVYRREHLAAVMDGINHYRPMSVIDWGCGCGANYSFLKEILAKGTVHYQGIDASRFLIAKAKDLFETSEPEPRVKFDLGDVRSLPYADHAFDLGFSESLLPLVPNPLAALSEMARTTRFGFFASLYAVANPKAGLTYLRKEGAYALDAGATWKYRNGISEQIFYLPKIEEVRAFGQKTPHIVTVENKRHQFFDGLGIRTVSVFFYPKAWYEKRRDAFKGWNDRPLM